MLAERAEQWAEQWKTAGLEQGIEQGLERGLEQGLERGELLGKIELLQQLLQYPPTPKSELAVFSLSQLHELLQQLQVQLQQQSRTE
jgi:flagellar biosynthesis/type III secretory pathway protein FliH